MVASMQKELPELVSLQEASRLLHCHPNTLRQWDKAGTLVAVRFGKRGVRKYRREDLLRLLTGTKEVRTSFQNIAEELPALLAVYTLATGSYVYVNKSVKKLLGYSPEDFLQGGIAFATSLIHPDDVAGLLIENQNALLAANQSRSIDGEPIFTFEYRMRHKNGSWRWLHTDGSVFARSEDGKVSSILNVSLDITKRKEMEENYKSLTTNLEHGVAERTKMLAESEERYRTFVAQSTEGIWRFELDKSISISLPPKMQIALCFRHAYLAECNDAMAQMYGFSSAKELVGTRLKDLLIPSDQANIDYLAAFIDSGYRLTNAESHEKDRLGHDIYFQNNLIGIIENGCLVRAWGMQKDITSQRRMEAELRENEERLRIATHAGKIGVWDWDVVHNKITWSDRVYEMHGSKQGEFHGTFENFIANVYPEDRATVRSLIKKALAHKGQYELEFRAYGPNKSVIWIATSARVIFDEDNRPLRMLGASIDITQRKELEQRKDDFIALASHELKTPVTSLKMYTQLLHRNLKKQSEEQMRKYLVAMDTQINKLTRLINGLLDVSRVKEKKIAYKHETFFIGELVGEVVNNIRRIHKEHKIIIKGRMQQKVIADRERVGQVLTNLINNAIKYSPEADRIIVRFQREGGSILLSVQDFGIGISKSEQERVFGKFFQLNKPVKEDFPGLGLGLYISKEIITLHGGKIWLESQEGEGTIFYFTLPLRSLK
jgi:PAS domain S-box-containing protein